VNADLPFSVVILEVAFSGIEGDARAGEHGDDDAVRHDQPVVVLEGGGEGRRSTRDDGRLVKGGGMVSGASEHTTVTLFDVIVPTSTSGAGPDGRTAVTKIRPLVVPPA
jgi:hypothetical protein